MLNTKIDLELEKINQLNVISQGALGTFRSLVMAESRNIDSIYRENADLARKNQMEYELINRIQFYYQMALSVHEMADRVQQAKQIESLPIPQQDKIELTDALNVTVNTVKKTAAVLFSEAVLDSNKQFDSAPLKDMMQVSGNVYRYAEKPQDPEALQGLLSSTQLASNRSSWSVLKGALLALTSVAVGVAISVLTGGAAAALGVPLAIAGITEGIKMMAKGDPESVTAVDKLEKKLQKLGIAASDASSQNLAQEGQSPRSHRH